MCVNPSGQDFSARTQPERNLSTYFQAGPNPHLETLLRHLDSTRLLASVPPQPFWHAILPFSLLDLNRQIPYPLPLSQLPGAGNSDLSVNKDNDNSS